MAKSKGEYDLIVIGSGAAGGVAAQIASSQGKRVALIEADQPGGETPNYGAMPNKALLTAAAAYQSARHASKYGIRTASVAYNYPSVLSWKEKVIEASGVHKNAYEREGIKLFRGNAQFIDKKSIRVDGELLTGKRFLIATGSSERIPNIAGLEEAGYLTYRDIMELKAPPKQLIIIGAGATGVEFAELFASFGSKVILLEREHRLLPKEDAEVGKAIKSILEDRGVEVHTGFQATSATLATKHKRKVNSQHGVEVTADEVLVACGRFANVDLNLKEAKIKFDESGIVVDSFLQTTRPNIYAAGDVVGEPHHTHAAAYQGRIAAHNLFSKKKIELQTEVIPRCVFTWPEVACIGATREEILNMKKVRTRTVELPIAVTAKSIVTGEDEGFVKITATHDGTIMSACIVAPRATDMIHEIALAMQSGLGVHDIANTVHAFPSWSDAVRVACSQF